MPSDNSAEDVIDRSVKNVQNDHLCEARKEIQSYLQTHDASNGASVSVKFFGQINAEQRAAISSQLFEKGTTASIMLDSDKNGAFSDAELKQLLRTNNGSSLERTAAAYMLLNSDRLSAGTGQITPENLKRESVPFALPPITLVEKNLAQRDRPESVKSPDNSGGETPKKVEEQKLPTGATVEKSPDGDLLVKRSDGSSVLASGGASASTIIEKTGEGVATKWTRAADSRTWLSDPPGKERQDMQLEKNGNLLFTQNGDKHILRSNGAELVEGAGRASFGFDAGGRISRIDYPDGNNSFSFDYKGQTENIDSVSCLDKQTKAVTTFETSSRWGKPNLSPDGIYSQEAYQILGGQIFRGRQTFGTDGRDEINTLLIDNTVRTTDGYGHVTGTRNALASDYVAGVMPILKREQSAPSERKNQSGDHAVDPEVKETTTSTRNRNEATDTSFHLKGYTLPSPDQLGAGSCLYMAATGIAEFLANKAAGITEPKVGGVNDFSERWTIELGKRVGLSNPYTDAVDLLSRGGVVPDSKLPFPAYETSSWISERPVNVAEKDVSRNLPAIEKNVLFSAGAEGSQNMYGVMTPRALEQIKQYLRSNESPVLFVYKPPSANYWHANMITGYDDKKKTFTIRDSSFGNRQTNLAPYNYGGTSRWGPQQYRGEFELSYDQALQWGNHATGYRLAEVSIHENQRN